MQTMETSPNTNPQSPEPADKPDNPTSQPGKKKLYIGVAIALLIVGILGIGGYFAATSLVKKETPPVASTPEYSDDVVRRANALPLDMREAIQKNLGISPEEYIKQSDNANELAKESDELSKESPDTYAGSFIDEKGEKQIVVNNTTQSNGSSSIADKAKVTVDKARASVAELKKTMQECLTWASSLPAAQQNQVSGVGINQKVGKVIVDVNKPAAATDGDASQSSTKPAKCFLNKIPQTATDLAQKAWPGAPAAPSGNNSSNTPVQSQPAPNSSPAPTPTTPAAPQTFETPAPTPAPQVSNSQLLGGDAYGIPYTDADGSKKGGYCSIGFALKDPNGGIAVTSAAHCTIAAASVNAGAPVIVPITQLTDPSKYQPFGTFTTYKYGGEFDYSIINVTNPKFATQVGSGAIRSNTNPVFVDGATTPVDGAPVCKSGATTQWTCGRVVNANFSFRGAAASQKSVSIKGFKLDACLRPGDSGGPIVTGTKALGMTDWILNPRGDCASGGGQGSAAGVGIVPVLRDQPGYKLITHN